MFDWNKPFQQKRFIGNVDAPRHSLVGVCDPQLRGGETHIVQVGDAIMSFTDKGNYYPDKPSEFDLVNIPEKKVVERWVVVGNQDIASTHSSLEYAQQTAKDWQAVGVECRIHHIREEF